MSRSIVVVDDEKLVIYGICSLLSEDDTGYQVAAACSSGEEGLTFCIDNPPDLLLTDIGMPGMSGLELIEKVRQTDKDMKIVVLSCHDEYDMVHKAFLLGADDYILKKDIEKDKLFAVLNKLLPEGANSNRVQPKPEMISKLSDCRDFSPEYIGSLGIIGFKGEYQSEEEVFWQPDIPMLHQLIKDELPSCCRFYLGLRNDIVIYLPGSDYLDEASVARLLEKSRLSIAKYINRPVFIAGHTMKEAENSMQAYNSAQRVLDGSFYCSESAVLTRPTTVPVWKSPLIFSISECSLEQNWQRETDEFFSLAFEQWVSPEAVQAELTFAVKHLLHYVLPENDSDLSRHIVDQNIPYYHRITQFSDFLQLKNWLNNFLFEIAEKIESGRFGCSSVSKAKLFINENIQQDLRLTVVAEILGINANHLSTIFKRETGQSYVEYVNKIRVRHACELLETTDYSAKDIAFRCGYPNPNYFSRIFKKLTDLTVSEYRAGRKQ